MVVEFLQSAGRLGRALLDIVLPAMCPTCGERLGPLDQVMCNDCWERIAEVRRPVCPLCGLEGVAVEAKCPGCLKAEIHYTLARQPVHLREPVETAIHLLKYRSVAELAEPLARLAVKMLKRDWAECDWDLVVPVPLHRTRERERGYNQSALIARHIGRMLGRPVSQGNLIRHRATKSQTNLSRAERLTNVAGAFSAERPEEFTHKRILLVDDVYTTGATINESARPLRRAGALEVFAISIARAE